MIVAGVDVGSLYTKTAILEVNDSARQPKIVGQYVSRSGALYKAAACRAFEQALAMHGLNRDDVAHVVSTGYGRYQVSFSDSHISEISAHARGAKFLFPDILTLIDIGGQDSRAIRIDDFGGVADFAMNDKCAAGTGRFLEVMAQGLEVELGQLGELSLRSTRDVQISSVCTVFAESEVISLLSEGCDRVDIISGIHRAIADRMMGMARRIGIKERVAMSGGVAKNIGMVRALERRLGTQMLVAHEPQTIGALGAALTASRRVQKAAREEAGV